MARPWVFAPVAAIALTQAAEAGSKAADYLVREQIAAACENGSGTIEGSAVIERDLTGDGRADLIISHEGITCAGGGRSSFCGAQVCSVNFYVRQGALLELAHEMLGMGLTVKEGGRVPIVHMYAHGGAEGTVEWDGREFRQGR